MVKHVLDAEIADVRGLAFCAVCRGGESDLPRECPGHPMAEETRAQVALGELDFVGGRWVWSAGSKVRGVNGGRFL